MLQRVRSVDCKMKCNRFLAPKRIHFEMDCVVGPHGFHDAFLVLTERGIRFEIILRLKHKNSEQAVRALNRLERRLGARTFSSKRRRSLDESLPPRHLQGQILPA